MIIWEVRAGSDDDLHYFTKKNDAYAYAIDYLMEHAPNKETLREWSVDLILEDEACGICSIGYAEVCEHYEPKRGDS